MKKFLALSVLSLLSLALAACSAPVAKETPKAKVAKEAPKTERTFFDPAVAEKLIPGKATREEVRAALGEPYDDPLKTENRWTYMYTFKKQLVFIFDKGIVTEKRWSEEYGISTGSK